MAGGGSGAVASEVNSIIKEVKDSLNVIKREITTLAAKPQVKIIFSNANMLVFI